MGTSLRYLHLSSRTEHVQTNTQPTHATYCLAPTPTKHHKFFSSPLREEWRRQLPSSHSASSVARARVTQRGTVSKSSTNLSPADVAERDLSVRLDLLNNRRASLRGIARSSACAALVQPLHERAVVPPQAEDQDHAAIKRPAHLTGAAQSQVLISTCEGAVRVVHDILLRAVDFDRGHLDNHAILNKQSRVRDHRVALVGVELRYHGEGARRVDGVVPLAVVLGVSHLVRVHGASALVADAGIAALATVRVAKVETSLVTGMWCDVGGAGVGLPNVQLVTADTGTFDVAL